MSDAVRDPGVHVPEGRSEDLGRIRDMIEKSLDRVNSALERAETVSKEARADAAEARTENQKLVAELAEMREQHEEQVVWAKKLDARLPRGGKTYESMIAADPNERKRHERQQFGMWMYDQLRADHGLNPIFGFERTQTEGTGSEGGHAVPTPILDGVVWLQEAAGFARSKCTVVQMGSETLAVPSATAEPTLYYPGELTAPSAESQAALVTPNASLAAKKLIAYDSVSIELQEDATPGYMTYLVDRFTRSMTLEEDNKLFNANNSPTGWYGALKKSGVGEQVLGTGSVSFSQIDHDELVNTLDAASEHIGDGEWVFNRKVLHHIRKVKDDQGQPLLAPLMAGAPSTLLGFVWNLHSKMPKTDTVSTEFIAYGDWKHAYFGDRRSVQVGFSDAAGNVFQQGGLMMRVMERYAITIVLPAAFGRLKSAAS